MSDTTLASKKLPSGAEWTFEAIGQYHEEIARVAANYKLDTYPVQVEMITSEQMMDAYASVGMPVNYHHWSFGKQFLATEKRYKRGQMGLAYEIVINSDPCIAYLMEENTLTMQALVIAHAAYGHNAFFKGNYLFRTWTSPDAIVDYLIFARNYIAQCEQRHGVDAVEELLDSCHALMNVGVDRYKRPPKLSLLKEQARQSERETYLQRQVNELWRTLPTRTTADTKEEAPRFPPEPQENILYFIEKHAPLLEPWQREIVRIVRKVAQYFFPQRQTQVMNEGWASFWHYTLLNTLYDEGLLADSFMMEFLHSHSSVMYQPNYNDPWYNGINPYALGFAMWQDIKRICESPTDEDREWFPDIAGSNWQETFDFAMRNFKDESFIAQFLSPRLMRAFKLFAVQDDDKKNKLFVSAIHEERGYRELRERLSNQYNLGCREPNIQVWSVDFRGDRSLTLRYQPYNRRPLGKSVEEVMKHLARLWGFAVRLETVEPNGSTTLTYECRTEKRRGDSKEKRARN
ncbi:MAG: SpoVR family protein [Denitromonas halophila]|nr:MAG: SpoVR family protein [Denitromonas halophila]TVT67498.1 MAG: SpoVR family protein [Denitromonas halophila]